MKKPHMKGSKLKSISVTDHGKVKVAAMSPSLKVAKPKFKKKMT